MKGTKVVVVLMFFVYMFLGIGFTSKAYEYPLDVTFEPVGEIKVGEESTFNVTVTNDNEAIYQQGELKFTACVDELALDYYFVENESILGLKTDEEVYAINKKDLYPGDTISFELKVTLQFEMDMASPFWIDVWDAKTGDFLGDGYFPDYCNMIDIYYDFGVSSEDSLVVKRGETVSGWIEVTNICDRPLEDIYAYMDAQSMGMLDQEYFADEMNFTVDDNFFDLAAGESKIINVSFTIPRDLKSSVVFVEICFYLPLGETGSSDAFLNSAYTYWELEGGTLNPFTDVRESDWFYPYVMNVYEGQIMTGMDADTFGPTNILSRAQFATILYRMAGQPKIASDSLICSDVMPNQFYTSAVVWAYDEGIITGYENGNFGPSDPITREQMATILYRYEKNYLGIIDEFDPDVELYFYNDKADVSPFAKEGMAWAVRNGIITGDGGKLNPQGFANRAHCAAIVSRYMGFY